MDVGNQLHTAFVPIVSTGLILIPCTKDSSGRGAIICLHVVVKKMVKAALLGEFSRFSRISLNQAALKTELVKDEESVDERGIVNLGYKGKLG